MADIAAIFGWSPAVMGDFSLSELAAWRERARVRSGVHE